MLSNHTGDKIHSDITKHEITEYVIARVTECVIAKAREHIIAKVTEYEIEQDLRCSFVVPDQS